MVIAWLLLVADEDGGVTFGNHAVVQEHGEDPAVVDDNAEASGGVLHDV
jgi:hypothetical protein